MQEQAKSIASQKQTTVAQMQNLQGAILSLQEIKADATGDDLVEPLEIEPETTKDAPDADETEEVAK